MSLINQRLPPDATMTIVVVENDDAPACWELVQSISLRPDAPRIIYDLERRIGIPIARNRALKLALTQGPDWIAITDDDTRPDPNWLANLLAAQVQYDADVVSGRVEYVHPYPLPPFAFSLAEKYRDGQIVQRASCNNVMFAACLIDDGGMALRFAEHLFHGEDTDFFYRAHKTGAKMIYSTTCIVREEVPPERLTLSYQTRRNYYYAASSVDFIRRYQGRKAALRETLRRLLFHVPIAIFRLAMAPFVLLRGKPRFRKLLLKATRRLAGAMGAVAGLFGFIGNPYKK
jgi:succinoglycan biosynthesis protein ExoM